MAENTATRLKLPTEVYETPLVDVILSRLGSKILSDRVIVIEGMSSTGYTDCKYMSAVQDLRCLHEEFLSKREASHLEGLSKSVQSIKDWTTYNTHLVEMKTKYKTVDDSIYIDTMIKKLDYIVQITDIITTFTLRAKNNPEAEIVTKKNDFLRSFSINQSTGTITLPPVDICTGEIKKFCNFLFYHVSAIKSDSSEVKYERTRLRDSYRDILIHTVLKEGDTNFKEFTGSLESDLKKYNTEIETISAFFSLFYGTPLSEEENAKIKTRPLFIQLVKFYNEAIKSKSFLTFKKNSHAVEFSALMKQINAYFPQVWKDIAKSRVLLGLTRLLTYFYNHIYDSRKCRSYIAYNGLCRKYGDLLTMFDTPFEDLLKSRRVKFNSLTRYLRCLTQRELDFWGVNVSIAAENETFAKLKNLWISKDIDFFFCLVGFNQSNNRKIRSETWKKYLKVRSTDFDSIVNSEKNLSLRSRPASQGKVTLPEVTLVTLEKYKKGILDPLSRNLCLKGIFFNKRNPYFGDTLLKLQEDADKRTKELVYVVSPSHYDAWFEYVQTNHAKTSVMGKMSKTEFINFCSDVVKASIEELKTIY